MRPAPISQRPITEFDGHPVYYIDSIPTVLLSVHGDIAKGYTIESDLTTSKCVVARGHGYFAHGESVKEAMDDLERKIMANMPIEEKIAQFMERFDLDGEYSAEEFYNWHSTLTGSCKMGRDSFIKSHGINLTDRVTTRYFLDITKDAYGSEVIQRLTEAYADRSN